MYLSRNYIHWAFFFQKEVCQCLQGKVVACCGIMSRICGSSVVDLESIQVVFFWLVPGMLKSHVMQQRPAASGKPTPIATKCLKNP